MKTVIPLCLALLLAPHIHAGPRTSANYSIATDTLDTGGGSAASANYSNAGSAGAVTGLSGAANPPAIAKTGYLGELFEVTGLVVNSAAPSVNETAGIQLAAWQILDDESFLAIPATDVSWSVDSGPLAGISADGFATAGAVFQDTGATAGASFGGFTATLPLTVLETIPDNFGSYSGDGLDDTWQAQYFGADNPLAAPAADPDGDGLTNQFEFTAGLTPTDPQSRFTLRLEIVPGQPLQKRIVFHPRLDGRTYVVETRSSLTSGTWTPLSGGIVSDNGDERTVTDPSATGARKFYRVQISNP